MQTKVILKQDVYGLGEEGDVKKVKAGYARNYLIPYSYAVISNKANLEKLEEEREEINKRKEKKIETSKSLIEKINGIEISFEENISDKGRLFGSINQNNIIIDLKEKGFDIEKRQINLKAPIKELGEHKINISFYGNKTAEINVIIKEKQEKIEEVNENIETNEKAEEINEDDEITKKEVNIKNEELSGTDIENSNANEEINKNDEENTEINESEKEI